jgi:hypothetical protein
MTVWLLPLCPYCFLFPLLPNDIQVEEEKERFHHLTCLLSPTHFSRSNGSSSSCSSSTSVLPRRRHKDDVGSSYILPLFSVEIKSCYPNPPKKKKRRIVLFFSIHSTPISSSHVYPQHVKIVQKDYNFAGYISVLNYCPRFRNQDAYETWAMI